MSYFRNKYYEMKKILITWTSWFVWYYVAKKLLEEWYEIIWIDNENDYYDINLKLFRRNKLLEWSKNFKFFKWDLSYIEFINWIFENYSFDWVIHLAAQAWVRYSLENPRQYINSNLIWFFNIIENVKNKWIPKLIYASSSSVYGNNSKHPFSIEDKVDSPISLYAATKKSNELVAYSYWHLYWFDTVWLRFFTVYWPIWRPDMAYYKFAKNIMNWKSIEVYNNWEMWRDFTYIDDIVDWVIKAYNKWWKNIVLNLWNDKPEKLLKMIEILEKWLWKTASKKYIWMQPWDVEKTRADIEFTKNYINWEPKTKIEEWISKFCSWYKGFYN